MSNPTTLPWRSQPVSDGTDVLVVNGDGQAVAVTMRPGMVVVIVEAVNQWAQMVAALEVADTLLLDYLRTWLADGDEFRLAHGVHKIRLRAQGLL